MKKILFLTVCTLIGGLHNLSCSAEDFSFDLDAAINESESNSKTTSGETPAATGSSAKAIYPTVDAQSYLTSTNTMYYDPALIESLIQKYKEKNYIGCIQEAQSKMQQDNPNPVAMYYMALAYTQIGDVKAALDLYDAILKLKPSDTLTECAIRGRDCLIGGPSCPSVGVEGAEIDNQVKEYKQESGLYEDSTAPQTTVPISQILNEDEIKTLPDMLVDSSKKNSVDEQISENTQENNIITEQIPEQNNKIPNNEDVAKALNTLRDAGIAVTIQPNPTSSIAQNYNSEMAQMSMFLGNNQPNRSLDMLPYMMMQSQNNPNQYNPQMVQAMMMNYMMPSMDFNSNNKN